MITAVAANELCFPILLDQPKYGLSSEALLLRFCADDLSGVSQPSRCAVHSEIYYSSGQRHGRVRLWARDGEDPPIGMTLTRFGAMHGANASSTSSYDSRTTVFRETAQPTRHLLDLHLLRFLISSMSKSLVSLPPRPSFRMLRSSGRSGVH